MRRYRNASSESWGRPYIQDEVFDLSDDGDLLDADLSVLDDEELGTLWYSSEEFKAARRELYDSMKVFNAWVTRNWNYITPTLRTQYHNLMNRYGTFINDTANLADEVLYTSSNVAALRDFQSQFASLVPAIERSAGRSSGVTPPATPTDRPNIVENVVGGVQSAGADISLLLKLGICAFILSELMKTYRSS